MNIPRISAERPVSVLMLYAALSVTGLVSLFRLEVNMFPEISIPAAYAITSSESLSAVEMENMVTIPVENSLSSVKGIKEISSFSKEGISSVMLKLDWNENMETASGEIREKIDSVYPLLPYDAEKPLLFFKNLSDSKILTLAVSPVGGKTISEISWIVETDLKSRLLASDGISEVKISGIREKEIKVDVDYPALTNTGIPLSTVTDAVSSSVFSHPAGKVRKGIYEYRVKTETDIIKAEDLGNIYLPGKGGLKLEDIADIYTGKKDVQSWFHSEGKKCIGLEIIKSGNSGLLNTAEKLHQLIPRLNRIFKNDFIIKVIEDKSVLLRKTINSLLITISAGIISAVFVLFIFFKNRKIIFTVILSLPLSLFPVFIYMYSAGISVNIISLTGLIIGTGMVFDNTIAVLEKLVREKPETIEDTGKTVLNETLSVSGSTLTTIIIFIPLLFISGLAGKLFKDLALTIIAFLISSAVVSMTVPPALYMLLDIKTAELEKKGRVLLILESGFRKYLSIRIIKTFPAALFFIIPLFLLPFIEKEIVPAGYEKKIQAEIVYRPGFSASYYSDKSALIEKELLISGLVNKTHTKGGVELKSIKERGTSDNGLNTAVFYITGSSSFKGNSDEFSKALETFFSSFEGEVRFSRNGSFLDRIAGDSQAAEFLISSENREEGQKVISEIRSDLKTVNSKVKMSGDFIKTDPGYSLVFNNAGFSAAGITPLMSGRFLMNSVRGIKAASLDTGSGTETDIVVRYRKEYTDSAEKIASLRIPLSRGGVFDPEACTDVIFKRNYPFLSRHNRKPCFHLAINYDIEQRDKIFDLLKKYEDSGIQSVSSPIKSEFIRELIMLFISALILIYFFLGAQFESFLTPLYLMAAIPFSISGSLMLLFITGNSLNISSFLGILILTGTSVNTAIMLFSEQKKKNIPMRKAAENRLLPSSAAILTTSAALMPAAFQTQNVIQSSSALALAGGLISGGSAVLLLYPLIFRKNGNRAAGIIHERH